MAPLDADTKEPRCIGIKPSMYAQPVPYPPCKLRLLNEQELKLVDIRNSKTEPPEANPQGDRQAAEGGAEASGRATEPSDAETRTAILGGRVVKVDRRTGELLDWDEDNDGYSG